MLMKTQPFLVRYPKDKLNLETRYKRRKAEEIQELKKKTGIPKVPWYKQGENDPHETVN
jgi:hypothetical protein